MTKKKILASILTLAMMLMLMAGISLSASAAVALEDFTLVFQNNNNGINLYDDDGGAVYTGNAGKWSLIMPIAPFCFANSIKPLL